MGYTFEPTTTSADAPDIEAGWYDARFEGIEAKRIRGGQYAKDLENGDPKIEWSFTLLADDGAVLYDGGDPLVVTKLTGIGFNMKSQTTPGEIKVLKALMTTTEFAQYTVDQKADEEQFIGRIVQVEVFIKDSGWPGVGSIIAPRKRRAQSAAPVGGDAE